MPPTDPTWRTRNLGRLLFAATDRCVEAKLGVVRRGFGTISEAQMALFLNLDLDGTRLTTIAARAGLTKQSMIELVDKAEALALVERRPDPDDRRAKVVSFTPLGRTLLGMLHQGIVAAENEVARIVGDAFLRDLRRGLRAYVAAPVSDEDAACRAPPPAAGDVAWRTDNIGRLFSLGARRFVREVLREVHKRGYREVTEVLLPLFRNLDLDGARLTALASSSRMTKQSMRELVDRAEALGFVERRSDPADGRAKAILFTQAGRIMLDEMGRGVARAEVDFARLTSPAFLEAIKTRLPDFIAGAGGDGEGRDSRLGGGLPSGADLLTVAS